MGWDGISVCLSLSGAGGWSADEISGMSGMAGKEGGGRGGGGWLSLGIICAYFIHLLYPYFPSGV